MYENSFCTFSYEQIPIIYSLLPTNGPVGILITIQGQNFVFTGKSSCKFNSIVTVPRYYNESMITCQVPDIIRFYTIVNISYSNNGVDYSNEFSFLPIEDTKIISISPRWGEIKGGMAINFTLNNLPDNSIVFCQFGSSKFRPEISSNGLVVCQSPPVSRQGFVSMSLWYNNALFIRSQTAARYYYHNFHFISISPPSGSLSSNTSVQIKGVNFDIQNIIIRFNNFELDVVVVNSSILIFNTPTVSIAGSYEIFLTLDSVYYITTGLFFTYYDALVLKSNYPKEGSSDVSTSVFITGNGFLNTRHLVCKFNNIISKSQFINSTAIFCFSPIGISANTYNLRVSNNGIEFSSSSLEFNINPVISLVSVSPLVGSVFGGTSVTIVGSFLTSSIYPTMCKFGFQSSSVIVTAQILNSSSIVCLAPPTPFFGFVGGNVPIFLSRNQFDFSFIGHWFTYSSPISLFYANPTYGDADGRWPITIHGSSFISSPLLSCKFNDILVSAKFISSSIISCLVPSSIQLGVSDVSLFNISVSNNHQEFVFLNVSLKFLPTPLVIKLIPEFGSFNGGTPVTVQGFNFFLQKRILCSFGDIIVKGSFVNSTVVICQSPAFHHFLPINVSISVFEGYFSKTSQIFTPISPYILELYPKLVPLSNNSYINISGFNFVDSSFSRCRFNREVYTSLIYVSETLIRCQVAPFFAIGNFLLEVTFNQVEFVASRIFIQVVKPIYVEKIRPSNGLVSGGTDVLILGSHFKPFNSMYCRFGLHNAVRSRFINDTALSCISPSSVSATSENVYISQNGVDFINYNSIFFNYLPITNLVLYPTSGPNIGGTFITIINANFGVVNSSQWKCRFGLKHVVEASYFNSNVTCTSPSFTSDTVAYAPVYISSNGYDWIFVNNFDYYPSPLIRLATPSSGSLSGQTIVTLIGQAFGINSLSRCRFGSTYSSLVLAGSNNTYIRCLTSSSTRKSLTPIFIAVNGIDFQNTGARFEFRDLDIFQVTPSSGYVGTALTIIGLNFVGNSGASCRFIGNTTITVFAVVKYSDSSIVCMLPADLGKIIYLEVRYILFLFLT